MKNTFLLFALILFSCKSGDLYKISKKHIQNNINNKCFVLNYTIKRYQTFSNDTYYFNISYYYKPTTDTSGIHILETINSIKKSIDNSNIFLDTLYNHRQEFTIFDDEKQYSYLTGKITDTVFISEKTYRTNLFSSFPLWINLEYLNKKWLNGFAYSRQTKDWNDSLKNKSLKFESGKLVYAKTRLLGTFGHLINEFYLNSYSLIDTSEFNTKLLNSIKLIDQNSIFMNHSNLVKNSDSNKISMPNLTLLRYPENESFELKPGNKLLLLDFSYARCAPCMLAMPTIDSIAIKYKDYIDAYTIDPMDKFPKDSILLVKFYNSKLRNKNTNFSLCDISLTHQDKLNIIAFPTILLVDYNGKIIFRYKGFSENLKPLLENAIENHISGLNKK